MATADATMGAGSAPKPRYGSMSQDRKWALRWSYFFLTLFAIFFLLPPIYMLITSLKTSQEISAATNPWWVYNPTLANYKELLGSSTYLTFFRNSAIVSICVVTVTMLISVPAAFALARMKFWGSATLATGVFLTYLIPDSLLFIPLFKMFALFSDWTGIQLINRWYVLIFLYPTLGLVSLTMVIAVTLVAQGITSLMVGGGVGDTGARRWLILSAVISIVAGLLILFDLPSSAGWTLGTIVGAALLLQGVSLTLLALEVRRDAA